MYYTIFYDRYIKSGMNPKSGDEIPYFSISSMSIVTAGIIALMKELQPNLTPQECKNILQVTSKEIMFNGYNINNVADANHAINYIINITI